MRYVAAYLLAVLGGNPDPDFSALNAILSAAGAEVDHDHVHQVLAELRGKDISEIVRSGRAKLGSVSFGGGGGGGGGAGGSSSSAAPTSDAGASTAAQAAPEPEPEPEKEESDDGMEGGFGFFDD
eukprot:TRINITY_DN1424_c0_g1_i1.p1 TRINITY_DN1424_c0_g1~~TRINITY_DN1424_c0_g1_i1.p1  ORF type:complete len:125 (-),score=32.08 TRINITY_DN1424_c0_g1_i1:56-430(-)